MSLQLVHRAAAVVGLILLVAVRAVAQAPAPTPDLLPPDLESQFREADANHDGSLTKQEARRGNVTFTDKFDSVDADRNGIVTLFELGKTVQSSVRRWLSDWDAADKNHDGELSPEEVRAAPSSVRSILTGRANRDQQPTRDEYESLARRQLYGNVDMPSVVPNIFEKRF